MRKIFFIFLMLAAWGVFSQDVLIENKYKSCFEAAYISFPQIPRGLLEAVAFTQTRFRHIDESFAESDIGLPKAWGIMGLVEDGKNYFRENLRLVAGFSGISVEDIKHNPCKNVYAYAKAFATIAQEKKINSQKPEDYKEVIAELSELPQDSNKVNDFAMESFLYSVYDFLNNNYYSKNYDFPDYKINMEKLFGENLKILSSPKVIIKDGVIENENGDEYFVDDGKDVCPDYNVSNCQWVAADASNYSSRNGTAISAIVIHTIQGSYSSCIAWFQNENADVSAHYVLRSSDGQITQMVREADKAWHVGSENPYTVGYEHEGYIEEQGWYTTAMYQSSAGITRHVCSAYGINPYRMFYRDTLDDGTVLDDSVHALAGDSYCIKIAGHQHYPNNTHTDPGPNWNWNYYFRLVNQGNGDWTALIDSSGTFYDSGGATGNYGDDERKFWLLQPQNADRVVLTFDSFDLEDNYDFLYIYDGDNEFAPLIGRWNTQSPGTVISSGNSLLVEFRSDCATNAAGWQASWYGVENDSQPPTTSISTDGGHWKTEDFTATFTDTDNIGVEKAFYQVIETDGTNWFANSNNGFFADNFTTMQNFWTVVSGNWSIADNNYLYQSDETISNTNIYAYLKQDLSNRYLYEMNIKVEDVGTNRRFGLHIFSDSASLENRWNGYFIWFRVDDQNLQFYKVTDDEFSLVHQVNNVVISPEVWYNIKIVFDRFLGKFWVYVNDVLAGTYTDSNPYSNGKYISLRTGNCRLYLSQLKVYRSRYPQVTVSVGAEANNDITVQNFDTSYCAKVKSIVMDSAANLSEVAYHNLYIDYTPPTMPDFVNDGTSDDIDITDQTNTLSANWGTSTDAHSGVAKYWYSIGTSPGGTDVADWTDNGNSTTVTVNGIILQSGTTYYFNIKAENNAGLFSEVISSDGVVLQGSIYAGFEYDNDSLCGGGTVHFLNTSQNADSYKWYFEGGNPQFSTEENPVVDYEQPGIFDVKLVAYRGADSAVYYRTGLINVLQKPEVDFYAEDTLVYLPQAVVTFYNMSDANADSYFWTFGDGTSYSSQTYVSEFDHAYTTTGTYTVSLIVEKNGCADTVEKENYITVAYQTSVDLLNDDFNVSPNPFIRKINVTLQQQDEIPEFILLAPNGKCFDINVSQSKNSYIITTGNLPAGIYLLRIVTKEKIYEKKLIKIN